MASRIPLLTLLVLAVVGLLGAAYSKRTAAPALAAAVDSPSARSVATALAASDPSSPPLPEAVRLSVRRQLYESVDALLEAGEFQKARQLLDDDTARYGVDVALEWRDVGESYRLIADCLEHPSASVRERAEAFVVVSHATGLESRVWSACGHRTRVVRR